MKKKFMFIYEKVAEDIARAVSGGQLLPGVRIPSIRDYAITHGISINSVKTAYRLLEDRGIITARSQSGYFVNPRVPELSYPEKIYAPDETLPLSGISHLLSVIVEKQQNGDYTDLAMACPTGEQFYPAGRLKKMVSQVLRSAKNFQSTYALPPGPMRLRSQIARRGLQLGMLLSAENILITHGAMEALSLAVRASTRPGDCIALEVPTFYNLYPMLEDLGRRIIGIPTHPLEGMCLNTLEHTVSEQNVRAVITVPSGQNPLGFTMSVENRQRLFYCIMVCLQQAFIAAGKDKHRDAFGCRKGKVVPRSVHVCTLHLLAQHHAVGQIAVQNVRERIQVSPAMKARPARYRPDKLPPDR